MKYEVQTQLVCGWENCWTIFDENGTEQLEYFDTPSEAQLAIDECLAGIDQAVAGGDMEEGWSPDDFRIMEVKDD